MSLTKPIPRKMREEMAIDQFYKRCCITGEGGKIDWHHNFTFKGERVNEKWCILPVTPEIHRQVSNPFIRGHLDLIMLLRADEDTLKKYSKAVDLIAKRERLKKRYGILTKILRKSYRA